MDIVERDKRVDKAFRVFKYSMLRIIDVEFPETDSGAALAEIEERFEHLHTLASTIRSDANSEIITIICQLAFLYLLIEQGK